VTGSGGLALWSRLREAGIVEGDAPEGGLHSPWYVRVMLGVAGWIGALFLLGFLGLGFTVLMKSATAAFVAGAAVCAGATVLFRSAPKSDFMGQFGLAASLAGQALMVFGLAQWFQHSFSAAALAIALLQGLLFALVPNFIHRVWSSWTAALAALYALGYYGLQAVVPAAAMFAALWPWLVEFDRPRQGELLRSAGYGLALAAIQSGSVYGALGMLWIGLGHEHAPFGAEMQRWLSGFACGAVLIWAVLRLLRREGVGLGEGHGRFALGGAIVLALVALRAPGVAPATALLVVGFANGNRVLAGLGVLALLGYLSHFYYALDATLLYKSMLLAAAGAALLAARFGLRRWWPAAQREVRHA
jgi:hypothetical protein